MTETLVNKKKRKYSSLAASQDNIPNIDNSWTSATKLRNYIINDPLLDWLSMYGKTKGFRPDNQHSGYNEHLDFMQFLFRQGNLFEQKIMDRLKTKFGTKLVTISLPNRFDYKTAAEKTVELIKAGTPIIAQGFVYNPSNKTFGFPDLLVRSDYINQLADDQVLANIDTGCAVSTEWHYRVVDIKFSTIKLRANMTTMLTTPSQKTYKAQLYVYNKALNHMQGYEPNRAYILGRGWEATKKGQTYASKDPFSKLAVVDFADIDADIAEDVHDAIDWVNRLKQEGKSWDVLPKPSVPELYPNMSNDKASEWDVEKTAIAHILKEITLVWQCGYGARMLAHEEGIFNWDDPALEASTMGINGKIMAPLVNKILDTNRGDKLVCPAKIVSTLHNWRNIVDEYFIDIETVSSVIDLDNASGTLIYLIGVGRLEDSVWKYRSFTVDKLTQSEEARIVREFIDSIPKDKQTVLWHYSNIEPRILLDVCDRERIDDSNLFFRDLYELFKSEPITVKDALDFSLKSLVKSLHSVGKIDISYDSSVIQSGLTSILAADIAAKDTDITFAKHDLIGEVIKYNEIDCQCISKILTYLRHNH